MKRIFQPWILLAWTAALVSPAAADWLVTAGGEAIETSGPWKVKGRVVVFTDAKGALSSLRLDDVDLEASETATAEAAAPQPELPAAEPEEVERQPVMVLTDADVARGTEDRPAGRLTVTMYGTASCGYCRKARKLLDEIGVAFIEKDIRQDLAALREFVRLTGGRGGVPVFDFAGTVVQGYDEETIRGHVARLGYSVEPKDDP